MQMNSGCRSGRLESLLRQTVGVSLETEEEMRKVNVVLIQSVGLEMLATVMGNLDTNAASSRYRQQGQFNPTTPQVHIWLAPTTSLPGSLQIEVDLPLPVLGSPYL